MIAKQSVNHVFATTLAEGVRWGWESFSGYARAFDAMPHSIDFMTLVPRDPLRLYVMGDRAARCEAATAEDNARMQQLLRVALKDGAGGAVGTARPGRWTKATSAQDIR